MKRLSVLGSTGSIGSQTLDIARAHPDDFSIVALAAGKNSLVELAAQVREFRPQLTAVPDDKSAAELRQQLGSYNTGCEIVVGQSGLEDVAAHPLADTVVSGVVGALGIVPTAAAVRAGKVIALANKETLVAAGAVIMPMCKKYGATIVPVDSEHSAIHQSLSGFKTEDVKRILLTGSGGPFRTWSTEQIANATVDDALKHPNWAMGPKITIDSATLMNKGLEIIEARWLFDIDASRIKVLIHPQSILHSAVEFVDGSVVGQMGLPDMHLPIHYALYWPQRRVSTQVPLLDFVKIGSMTFEEPDLHRFPCLRLASEAAAQENTIPAALNAANEIVVEAFLQRSIKFRQIPEYIQKVLELHQPINNPALDDILEADRWARKAANELLGVLTR